MKLREALSKAAAAIFSLWASRKLWMTIFGVVVIFGIYWHSVWYVIYIVQPEKAPIVNDMFQTMMWGVVTMIVSYVVGAAALQGFTRNTSSVANIASNILFGKTKHEEKIEHNINITEKVDKNVVHEFAERFKDDPSYRPPETVPDKDVEEFR